MENTPFYREYRPIGILTQKVTRVIAFANKKEFKEELQKLEEDAQGLVLREDLRVARITDAKVIKHFKQKYNNVWFDKLSSNSIVLLRRKEDFIGQ